MEEEVKKETIENGEKKEKIAEKESVQSQSKTETLEFPFKGRRSQNTVKDEALERRMQLVGVVKKIGYRNAFDEIKIWAKHYKVHERTIYKDFKWIKGNFKPSNLEEIKIDLEVARDRVLKSALDVLSKSTILEDVNSAIKTLISAGKHVREELEGWGMKEKVEDKIQINSGITFNLIEKSIEEIKDAKNTSNSNKQPDSESKADGDPKGPGR